MSLMISTSSLQQQRQHSTSSISTNNPKIISSNDGQRKQPPIKRILIKYKSLKIDDINCHQCQTRNLCIFFRFITLNKKLYK
ncbi:hypothetical protein DERP_006808 [Dermatophagoides pteronyssinus]|uniref:Uncharacterized protein n=1 Tax=Dermatophagoides pteronyssinus TaxID=6956 RepID=A0ABQ8IS23_DERPT|nr:hypothetical protein DERP_006808 [Dermatophagoides pteronyssinus]